MPTGVAKWGTDLISPKRADGKVRNKSKVWLHNSLLHDSSVSHHVQVVARNVVVFLRNGVKITGCSITRYGKARKPRNWRGDWNEVKVRKVANQLYIQEGTDLIQLANKLRY